MANSSFPLMFQPLARYADFNGRSRRSEYWLWALFLFLLNVGLSIVQYALMFSTMGVTHDGHMSPATGTGFGLAMMINLLKFVIFLALIVPSVAVAVRRMHDINRTGWWILLPSGVGLVALIIVFSTTGADFFRQISELSKAGNSGDPAASLNMVFSIMRMLLWVVIPTLAAKVVTFVFRVTEGTKGTNRYGPDPKGGAPVNVF
jgi:uncharacterized membrane protein YhaH (DUF805 family)